MGWSEPGERGVLVAAEAEERSGWRVLGGVRKWREKRETGGDGRTPFVGFLSWCFLTLCYGTVMQLFRIGCLSSWPRYRQDLRRTLAGHAKWQNIQYEMISLLAGEQCCIAVSITGQNLIEGDGSFLCVYPRVVSSSCCRYRKEKQDAKKSANINKCALRIVAAVRNSGGDGDPKSNHHLALELQKAKSFEMTKEKMERAIKSGQGIRTGQGKRFDELTYEGKLRPSIRIEGTQKQREKPPFLSSTAQIDGFLGDHAEFSLKFTASEESHFSSIA